MRVAQLQDLAASMGISGTAKMRKNDLLEVIKAQQSGRPAGTTVESPRTAPAKERTPRTAPAKDQPEPSTAQSSTAQVATTQSSTTQSPNDQRPASEDSQQTAAPQERPQGRRSRRASAPQGGERQQPAAQPDQAPAAEPVADGDSEDRGPRTRRDRQQGDRQQGDRQQGERQQGERQQGERQQGERQQGERQQDGYDDDGEGRGGRRRNRSRNRSRDKRRGREGGPAGGEFESEPQLLDDDVLVPVAGIVDVLDSYAFVRTSGYLAGPGDVYVPMGMVKRNGLRKGDAVTGQVKATVEGDDTGKQSVGGKDGRQKFNPLVRLDSINGMSVDDARKRPDFGKLTPLYPQERLRLETEPNVLTTRIIDLVAPIGKGQRGLIVAPAKAGKTMIMQMLANAITTNNPECHLMVVLVDERPEEVTDMSRAVKGEVISSTFDRPAEDHTTVAELAIERAKRLVEMGHDVVVLLDSITKLGRAYNLSAPASGRILSGGVDSAALYPPKKFFGAARNIEHGGSLTILATALVETGSRMDEVIFEEFKGTGNMELRLSRELANRRIFPAVDINASGTRREEILLGADELKIMWKLRRVLSALDPQQGIELLLDRLRKSKSNAEFLMQVQHTSSTRLDAEDDKS
ncbi:transcription termination factor Rho [Janibacter sp. G56]|uniref:transcription termination factor Rho n=1 Tax=Janibacter sp. G56 TaxID=3418717 RepID=UPI003CFDBE10